MKAKKMNATDLFQEMDIDQKEKISKEQFVKYLNK